MMKTSVLGLCALATLGVEAKRSTSWRDLEARPYSFSQYAAEFEKQYGSKEEYVMREALFTERLERIMAHNKKELSWKEGVNKFTDMTVDELNQFTGRNQDVFNKAGRPTSPLQQTHQASETADPPASIDWNQKGKVTPVHDQGSCGSCWAFAGTETAESHWAISSGNLTALSTQQMVDCTKNPQDCGGTGGCAGATAELGYGSSVDQGGIASNDDYPYTSGGSRMAGPCQANQFKKKATFTGFVKVEENNFTAVLDAVGLAGPLAVTVDSGPWFAESASWAAYEEGVFSGCSKTAVDLDHGVQIVGYGSDAGDDYWLVRNSWGNYWGDNGYIKILKSKTAADVTCGTDSSPSDGTGCNNGPKTIKACGECGILYDTSYPLVH